MPFSVSYLVQTINLSSVGTLLDISLTAWGAVYDIDLYILRQLKLDGDTFKVLDPKSPFFFLAGMQLPQMSLLVGMDSAKLLKSLVCQTQQARVHKGLQKLPLLSPDNVWRRKFSLKFFLVLSISLWVAAIALTVIDVDPSLTPLLPNP